jgi:hypothetical protein
MKKLLLAASAALALVSFAGAPAHAEGVVAGTLTCTKTGTGTTYVLYSSVPVECVYNGAGGTSKYKGTSGILLGVDLEWEHVAGATYVVLGGAGTKSPLDGYYVGARASATPGLGLSVQAGLAGAGNGFELVPVGIGGQAGVGVTAGIGYLSLTGAQ